MESEKVKEIKKAIQETIDGKLSTEYLTVCEISCCPRLDIDKLFTDILTLINELESENKQLLEENESLNGSWKMQLKKIAELEKEIEENAFYSKGYAQGIKNTYEVVVPEKLKQFAERLKSKDCSVPVYKGFILIEDHAIDETLKEFIGNV